MSRGTGSSIGVPYKRFVADGPFDAIVVGSGIGGMGVAALLARAAGQRVLVLEKHYTAGGFTHVFHRPGFEWDVGVHYVGQVHEPGSPSRALFDYVSEERLAWSPLPDVYDQIRIGGLRFDYVRGEERLHETLTRDFPREGRAIDRYFNAIRHCLARLPLFFLEKMLPPVPSWLAGRALRAPFLKLARRTTAAVLDDIGMSSELKAVLTAQWGDYGLPPGQSSFGIHALVTSHYFQGGAYPVGGSSRIATSLLPTIERTGGAVVIGAEVERIVVEHNRAVGVQMADGRVFTAPTVISDAGVRTTFDTLLREVGSPSARRVASAARGLPGSLAHLCLYAGLEPSRTPAALPGGNLWIHPGLDFDRNLAAFTADPDAPFPYVFVSFPSAKDPSFTARVEAGHTLEIATVAPYDLFATWAGTRWHHRGAAYDELKQRLAARMLAVLAEHMPQVAGAVKTWELSTPVSTEHFANAHHGAMYGLAHTPARFECRELRARTPIRGLYLTGQDVGTCGVMGALSGAVVTASVLLHRNLFSEVTKASTRQGPPANWEETRAA
jgi:all-trans-retinol 13,14-reductase